jgi:hypothetical protein
MSATFPCNDIQERLVAGAPLDEADQTHVLACPTCGRLASEHARLEAAFVDSLESSVRVPLGFADQVMATIAHERAQSPQRLDRLIARPWVQIVLAHVGLAVAIANVLRVVLASLLPTTSLGGAR